MRTEMLSTSHSLFRLCGVLVLALITNVSQASDITKGEVLYITHCVSCHGKSGVSDMADAPDFSQYNSLIKSDIELLDTISQGKNAMPLYKGTLSDEEIFDVIAYLRTLN